MGFQVFNWRGQRIDDIEAWAKERGEKMVYYKASRQTPWGLRRKKATCLSRFGRA